MVPSQSDLRKRQFRAARQPSGGVRRHRSRRDRQRRLVVGVVAVIVITMMVASLAVGLLA